MMHHVHLRIHHWVLWWFYVGVACGVVAMVNIFTRRPDSIAGGRRSDLWDALLGAGWSGLLGVRRRANPRTLTYRASQRAAQAARASAGTQPLTVMVDPEAR